MALWRQGGGAWHNALILTTASDANTWADVAYHVTRLWQAGDTGNFDSVSRARAAQSQDDYSASKKRADRYGSTKIYFPKQWYQMNNSAILADANKIDEWRCPVRL